jgi:hypothetical protein
MDDIRDATVTVFSACASAARGIADLPWPALLCAALLLAIVMTIIPLALTLFVTFLIIKFAVAALVIDKQRRRSD